MKRILVGITGASGSIYASRLLTHPALKEFEIHLIISETGEQVLEFELGKSPADIAGESSGRVVLQRNGDLFAPPASGSFVNEGMIIVPCSMTTLAGIAAGSLSSLIGRAAAVTLKEKRKLVVVPRETPLSRIQLKAMIELHDAGGTILPAMPGFYNKPSTVEELADFIVSRILTCMGIEGSGVQEWKGASL